MVGLRRAALLISGGGELGTTDDGRREQRFGSIRGTVSWTSPSSALSLVGSSYPYSGQSVSLRIAVNGSTAVGDWRFSSGGGLGRGACSAPRRVPGGSVDVGRATRPDRGLQVLSASP